MAIYRDDDDELLDSNSGNPSVPSIQTTHNFKTNAEMGLSIINNRDVILENMVGNIKGFIWSVDYFLQIATINDSISVPDINIPPTVQKYNRINKLELNVQTPIAQAEDISGITGEAIINCGFLPNVGDAFVTELTGGRSAIFTLKTIDIKTYNLRNVYFVTFELFTFLDTENIERYNDMIYKTVKEYVYDREHLLDFSAPVILATDYKKKTDLKKMFKTITDYYCSKFIDNDKRLLRLPTRYSVYFDSYLTKFMFKIIETDANPMLLNLNRYENNLLSEERTIWDAIVERDLELLKIVVPHLWYRPTFNNQNPIIRDLNYLGVNFILEKTDVHLDIEVDEVRNNIPTSIPHPMLETDISYYVLSEHFYKLDTVNCTNFERMVIHYLKGEIIHYNELEECLNNYYNWETTDQFYCIPLLLVLIKDVMNKTFISL